MSIEKAIEQKYKLVDKLMTRFEKSYNNLSKKALKEIEELYISDEMTFENLSAVFEKYGLDVLLEGFIEQYPDLIKQSKKLSREIEKSA